jgi:hypothetical protein
MNEFIKFAKSIGLYVGSPMKTEPRFSHPTTQAAWLTWKYLKNVK